MIFVAETCGLCQGAARALKIAEKQLKNPEKPIVLYNNLLHNDTVMANLQEQNVQTVHSIKDVPKNALAIVSAHGMPAKNYKYLAKNNIPCVDATCPKVISTHKIVEKGQKNGQAVVVIGKKNHPEVLGIAGWCKGAYIVQSAEDLTQLKNIKQQQVLVVCQSTFNEAKANQLFEGIQKSLLGKTVLVKNTICPAQKNIQISSVEMAKKCNYVFVIGGYNSSNTKELFKLCHSVCKKSYHVNSIDAFYSLIETLPLNSKMNIGLTAGASTTKEEIENCRSLLCYLLFYRQSSGALAKKILQFNGDISHKNAAVNQFIKCFLNMNKNGKNIRGVLVCLGYKLSGKKNLAHSLALALGAEVFQTAILVHDDIIDHAPVRRGLATVPHQYMQAYQNKLGKPPCKESREIANAVGICAGDVGFYYANLILANSYAKSPQLAKVFAYFSQMAANTMYGEVLDVVLPFEEKNGLGKGCREDAVMEIYHLKTAWYSVIGPLCLGMILGGAQTKEVQFIEDFANNLGLAFQIKDDLMGIFKSEESLGKPMCDIAEYKQTILYAFVQDKAPQYLPKLKAHYGKSPSSAKNVAAVRQIFAESGAQLYAKNKMKNLFKISINKLKMASFISDEDKTLLLGFINYLQLREK